MPPPLQGPRALEVNVCCRLGNGHAHSGWGVLGRVSGSSRPQLSWAGEGAGGEDPEMPPH